MQLQAQYQSMQQMQQFGSMNGMPPSSMSMGSMSGFGMNPWMMGGMGAPSTFGTFPPMGQGGSQLGMAGMHSPQQQMGSAQSPGGMDPVSTKSIGAVRRRDVS